MTKDDDTRSFEDVRDEVTDGESDLSEYMSEPLSVRHDGNRLIIDERLAITLWLNTDYDEGLKPTEYEWLDEGAFALTEPTTGHSVEILTQHLNGGKAKHTTGTVDGYGFSLRVDGDAPDALVADIEARLSECKAERENDE